MIDVARANLETPYHQEMYIAHVTRSKWDLVMKLRQTAYGNNNDLINNLQAHRVSFASQIPITEVGVFQAMDGSI